MFKRCIILHLPVITTKCKCSQNSVLPLLGSTVVPNLVPWVLKKKFVLRNGQKWDLFKGCKQTRCSFFRIYALKITPMPPMSRIGSEVTLVFHYCCLIYNVFNCDFLLKLERKIILDFWWKHKRGGAISKERKGGEGLQTMKLWSRGKGVLLKSFI